MSEMTTIQCVPVKAGECLRLAFKCGRVDTVTVDRCNDVYVNTSLTETTGGEYIPIARQATEWHPSFLQADPDKTNTIAFFTTSFFATDSLLQKFAYEGPLVTLSIHTPWGALDIYVIGIQPDPSPPIVAEVHTLDLPDPREMAVKWTELNERRGQVAILRPALERKRTQILAMVKESALLEVTLDNLSKAIDSMERERTVYLQACALRNHPNPSEPGPRRKLTFDVAMKVADAVDEV